MKPRLPALSRPQRDDDYEAQQAARFEEAAQARQRWAEEHGYPNFAAVMQVGIAIVGAGGDKTAAATARNEAWKTAKLAPGELEALLAKLPGNVPHETQSEYRDAKDIEESE